MPTSGSAILTTPSDTEILVTRDFDAPKHLVYKAWTTPELVSRWWPSRRGQMTVCEIDLRPGGAWRYVMVAEGGQEVAFHGEYTEIVENERIVATEIYEGTPDGDSPPEVNVITFTELPDGRTRLEMLMQCPTKEMRDVILDSGMEAGMQDGMDLLEEVAISLSGRVDG
ncbi:MAG TPA: SRPBCC family protein [Solirubrobacteraceae bacterium]|nr:SRPBCC family protein [Solirubrobacteraceae bacterium]